MSADNPVAPPEVMAERRLARDVVIDRVNGTLTIDGHEFPYWLAEQGPAVSAAEQPPAAPVAKLPVVMLPVLAQNVRLVTTEGTQSYASPWGKLPPDEPQAPPREGSGVALPPMNTMLYRDGTSVPITPLGEPVTGGG